MQFWKDKFEVLLVSIIFSLVFGAWVITDFRADIKEFLIAIFGAWLALLRVVQRPSQMQAGTVNADLITAENIESASTESGDINTKRTSKAIARKET